MWLLIEDVPKEIPDKYIPKGSYFTTLKNSEMIGDRQIMSITSENEGTHDEVVYKSALTNDEFDVIHDFLVNQVMPHHSWFHLLDQYNLNEYVNILTRELDIRNNLYNPDYINDKMNTDPYYELIKFTPEIYDRIKIAIEDNKTKVDRNLIFGHVNLKLRSYNEIVTTVKIFDNLFINEHVFVAGGCIFGTVFDSLYKDIDLFIHSTDEERAKDIIKYIAKEDGNNILNIMRTKNAITIRNYSYKEIQVILRLYRTPSEIIHSFDIDGCCMGYDGKDIYLTQRCLYSLLKGYNTVNLDLLSPSYTRRLIKYTQKGMKIFDYQFNRDNVKEFKNSDFPSLYIDMISKSIPRSEFHLKSNLIKLEHKYIYSLQGLNYLLYVEELIYRSGSKGYDTFLRYDPNSSDYDAWYVSQVIKKVKPKSKSVVNIDNENVTLIDTKGIKVKKVLNENFVGTYIFTPTGKEYKYKDRMKMLDHNDKRYVKNPLYTLTNKDDIKYLFGVIYKEVNNIKVKIHTPLTLSKDIKITNKLEKEGYHRIKDKYYANVHPDNKVHDYAAGKGTNPILNVIEHLINQKDKYPTFSKDYMPIIERIRQKFSIRDIDYMITRTGPEISISSGVGTDITRRDLVIIKPVNLGSRKYYNISTRSLIHDQSYPVNNLVRREFLNSINALFVIVNGVEYDNFKWSKDDEPITEELIIEINPKQRYLTKFRISPLIRRNLISIESDNYKDIAEIDDDIYSLLKIVMNVDLPKVITFKVIKPGEQATSTFQQLVLTDESTWYTGRYYKYNV